MKFLNLFKKKSLNWNDLSEEQRKFATKKIIKTIKNLSGAKYSVVQGENTTQREYPIVEHENEDNILTSNRRNRMLDLVRNAVRNSSTFNALLRQVDLNCVGTEGGKIIFNFDNPEVLSQIKHYFYKYTRETDFYDNLSFNTLLKIILKTYLIGGDMVLLFDDGLIENSGKICLFEPDEIMNSTDEAVKIHYGEDAYQSQGRVYNGNGRNIGVIVSRSCRGQEYAPEDKCYFLKRDPDEDYFSSKWIMPRNVWRASGGRGITQAASVIGTLIDENDLVGFELQAAKKSSQLFAQIISTNTSNNDAVLPSAFDENIDFSNLSDEEIAKVAKEETENYETTVSLDSARSAGIIYQQMPDNYKMECLSPNHPNLQTIDFVKWLASRSSAAFGLSQQYATLAATGADYKAERLLTEPFFRESQKFLEQICDWVFYRWQDWANKQSLIDSTVLGTSFMQKISWAWPRSAELDENVYQDAISKKIKNFTGSYLEILGPDWQEKLLQIKKEVEFFKVHNLAHPSYEMKSGGERTGAEEIKKETYEETI